jgi:hypothetical protein
MQRREEKVRGGGKYKLHDDVYSPVHHSSFFFFRCNELFQKSAERLDI